jgi:hypothetical protein
MLCKWAFQSEIQLFNSLLKNTLKKVIDTKKMEKSEYFLTNKGQKKACFDKNQKTCLRESIVFEYSSI